MNTIDWSEIGGLKYYDANKNNETCGKCPPSCAESEFHDNNNNTDATTVHIGRRCFQTYAYFSANFLFSRSLIEF